MTNGYSKITNLSEAFRDARRAQQIEIKEIADGLGVEQKTIESIEACDWEEITSDRAYDLSVAIAQRLGVDLEAHDINRALFFSDLEENDTSPATLRREKIVMFVMTSAAAIMLAWLLVPAHDISQPPPPESGVKTKQATVWQKPPSDQPYPVLGEVFPEAPITNEGVLISLRATDICNVRIKDEQGNEQQQTLRMSEPWKLRVQGAFVLYLDNAGVVSVEVAGQKIHHGIGVGREWSGKFDAEGHWDAPPPPRSIRPAIPTFVDDETNGIDSEQRQLTVEEELTDPATRYSNN